MEPLEMLYKIPKELQNTIQAIIFEGTNHEEIIRFLEDGKKYSPDLNQHLRYDPETLEIELTYSLKPLLNIGDYIFRKFSYLDCIYDVYDHNYYSNMLINETIIDDFKV